MSEAVVLSGTPSVVLFKDFISNRERLHLLELAEAKKQRSTVVDNVTGDSIVSDYRTGYLAMIGKAEDEIVRGIEDRIARVSFTRYEQGEPIQVIGYKRGDQYKPHNDWFDPAITGSKKQLVMGGQRIKTVMLYLRAPKAGGETRFTNLNINVKPFPGAALMWDNVLPGTTTVDHRVQHAGLPVRAGEKVVATRWIRSRAVDGSENNLTPNQLREKLCGQDVQRILDRYNCIMVNRAVIVQGKMLAEARIHVKP